MQHVSLQVMLILHNYLSSQFSLHEQGQLGRVRPGGWVMGKKQQHGQFANAGGSTTTWVEDRGFKCDA